MKWQNKLISKTYRLYTFVVSGFGFLSQKMGGNMYSFKELYKSKNEKFAHISGNS
jgi:hypothetical protein